MRRRTRIVLLEVLGFAVAGLLLALGVAVLRLFGGPIGVDALTPYVRDAVGDGVTLEVGRAEFAWGGWEQPLTVAAQDVRISARDGSLIARVPEVDVGLSVSRLVRGDVAPTRLRLVSPELNVIRTGDRSFAFIPDDVSGVGDGGDGGDDAPLDPLLMRLLGAVQAPSATPDAPYLLQRVQIVDGRIVVDDRWLNTQWRAEDAEIELVRRHDAIVGRAGFTQWLDDRPARQTARLTYPLSGGEATLQVTFSDLAVGVLARAHPVLEPLGIFDSVFQGTVELRLDRDLRSISGRFAVQGGAGRLQLDALYGRAIAVAGIMAEGEVDRATGTLRVAPLVIDLGGPQLSASGTVVEEDGMLDVAVELSLTSMPLDLFDQYWPPAIEPGGRAWVTQNLSRGIVRDAQSSLALRVPIDDLAAAEVLSADGELTFDGLTVRYMDDLPLVENLSGRGVFDIAGMRFEAGGGHSLDLSVLESTVAIDFTETPEMMDVEVVLSGPLSAVLTVLDAPGLGYASEIGLDSATADGSISGRLRATFPLIDALVFDQVALAAAANVRDARLGELADGLPAGVAEGALSLDGRGMTVSGTGTLGAAALDFTWSEPFGPGDGQGTRIDLSGTLDDEARRALGLPDYAALAGPIAVEATFSRGDGPAARFDTALDLTEAALAVAALDVSKPAGVPGTARFSAELLDGALVRLADIEVDTPDLSAAGHIDFASDGGTVQRAELTQIRWGRSRLRASLAPRDDGGYDLWAGGPFLDASAFIADAIGGAGEAEAEAGGADGASGTPLHLTLDFDEAEVDADIRLHELAGTLTYDGEGWAGAELTGRTEGDSMLHVRYAAETGGGARLRLQASDAGGVLRDLGLLDEVDGGRLLLDAIRPGPDEPLAGTLEIEEFRLRRAPTMARLLAALSLGGLQDSLDTEGIGFSRLIADLAFDGERLTVADGRMSGGALGLTMEGTLDVAGETIDMEGTIVPIYGVNRALGAIPLIGDVLVGGEGEGLLAFNYAITGGFAEPTVSVNPLSVLAPGFLRNLFLFDARPREGDGRHFPDVNR